jgi:hypothetical protein
MQRSRSANWVTAALVGLALGFLPHILGVFLGPANFLIAPIVLAVLAVVAGRRLGNWALIVLASGFTGIGYVGATAGTFAVLARLNGSWLQTMALPDAIYVTLSASAFAVLFMGVGWVLSRPRRAR